MEELAHRGYRLSTGTLYPMLHAMEKRGYLSSYGEPQGRAVRRLYVATDLGPDALVIARYKARELIEGHRRERTPPG
jgi:PadR family transcriptional regulator PadR